MSSDFSDIPQKMSEIGEKLENSCLELTKMRLEHDAISSKSEEMTNEELQLRQEIEDKCVQYKAEYYSQKSVIAQLDEDRIQKLEEEISAIGRKRKEVRFEVLLHRSQRKNLKRYLDELREKIEKRREEEQRLEAEQLKEKLISEQVSELEEILAHHQSKVVEEYAMLKGIWNTAVRKLRKQQEEVPIIDDHISKSKALIEELREEVFKGKMNQDLLAIETTNIWENIDDIMEEDFGESAAAGPDPKLEEAKDRFKVLVSEKYRRLGRASKLLGEAKQALGHLQALKVSYNVLEDDMEIERLEKEIEELEMKEICGTQEKGAGQGASTVLSVGEENTQPEDLGQSTENN